MRPVLKYVLTPIRIGACLVPNRVVSTAHGTFFGSGSVSDRLIAYHETRAKGGVGLIILEVLSVHSSSIYPFGGLRAYDDNLVKTYKKLMRQIRPYGTKVFQQLWHGGAHAATLDGSLPWGPSDVPGVTTGVVPHPMTRLEIQEIIQSYANTARLCEEGGLDGVELHGSHGYLVQQFMSPLTNKRTDEYGGPFENRIRFQMEILRAIRAAVSKDFVVGIRLSPEMIPGGLDSEANAHIVKVLEAEGLVNFVDVSMGSYFNWPKMVGGMHEPAGYQLDTSAIITAAASVPTIVTGRFRTLEEADQVIREGLSDLVGMTRAHIADPDIVSKTRDGRETEVRPCIACNQGCLGGVLEIGRVRCVVNPAVGQEQTLGEDKLKRVKSPKRVLVVGGGPSGMEAARVAALRGHTVILMEAMPRLGGTISLTRAIPRLQGLCDIIDWQQDEIYRLGVEIHTNTYAEAQDIIQLNPDAVIIATGSTPRMDGIQVKIPGKPITGLNQSHVLSTMTLLSEPGRDIGKTAVVIDDVGHYEAIGVAEYLMEKGLKVTFVTPHKEFAPLMELVLRAQPALERLAKGDFTLLTRAYLKTVYKKEVEVSYLYESASRRIPADTVVLISHNRPNSSLKEDLKDFKGKIQVVGDANSPMFLMNAIHGGYNAGSWV